MPPSLAEAYHAGVQHDNYRVTEHYTSTPAAPNCMHRKLQESAPGRLGPYIDKYMEHYRFHHSSVSGAYSYKNELDKLGLHLSDREPEEVTKRDLEDFCMKRTGHLAPATRKRVIQTVKSFFAYLAMMDMIGKNPALALEAPAIPKPEPRFLTREEIRRLHEAMDGNLMMQTYLSLGCYAGLRRGSMHGLRWDDIDFELENITVRKAKGNKTVVLPLHGQLDNTLLLWRKVTRDSDCPLVLAHRWQGSWRGYGYSQAFRQFKKYVALAGLPADTCAHDLRRTFASLMRQEGVDVAVISELLGHESISTTLDHYAFTSDKQKRTAIGCLQY